MRELFDCRGSATHALGVDDVLEVLQSDLSVLADGAAEHVLQPFQVLRRQLTPGTAKKKRERKAQNLDDAKSRNLQAQDRALDLERVSASDNSRKTFISRRR